MRSRAGGLSVIAIVIASCGGTDGPGGPGAGSSPPPAPVATNAVDVADNRFSPPNATIGPSVTVTWTWRGSALHNVTFEDGQGSSATKETGTHQRTFPGPGTFRYRCTIHSANFEAGMIGSVVVN